MAEKRIKKENSSLSQELARASRSPARFQSGPGLTEELVVEISRQKDEPEWMLERRLRGLELWQEKPMPAWGPSLDGLELDRLSYFVRPNAEESRYWKDVPTEIRRTFDRLGLPQAEREALSGVGAQFDSDVVYHNLKKEWKELGVIFESMDVAVRKYPELVRERFMSRCVPIGEHKFTALHAAVWSGGTFIYVPSGVEVTVPMQAYFRMNSERGGQFEHTLIVADEGSTVEYIEGCSAPNYTTSSLHAGCVEIFVGRNATVRYSSIENWSRNVYNLNTKRAVVDEGGTIEWLSGNLGSCTTMLYPCSVLAGRGARSDALGIAMAGVGQQQDTGFKAIHLAADTTSTIRTRSISKGGGRASYRGLVQVGPEAAAARSSVSCDALIIGSGSGSDTWPILRTVRGDSELTHEARVGRIGTEEMFYLMSRGLTEDEAIKMIVGGFVDPVVRRLPLEYAVELNRLVEMEMEGTVG
ncbi:Fe-S cluster assembly protein SufB [Candidatus Uhrbacteria bacterium CG_4_10_14_0_8_um_filter_58_22]|uniref:Fe-S cluster assembly protein SufB n=1 Tax=Candidatus Uhrbacteria bacterium CG_4_10_14_0_8_um_filter_58_22 TaxID=1975029 RepID=A0A2M7QAG0_9BACT|nr:MAG: Fe-S cluster assembly protein SufB [Candidatus Uhrbacteria bacterium CG_4_10_14_0_8_um_filter_58_22]